MTVHIFVGPSLPVDDRDDPGDVVWHEPAEAGDLCRLAADPGDTVCLIDGYFEHAPSVRHEEILLLMSRGIRMLGGASIGALRAAELSRFGMTGIGRIFGLYDSGTIIGDDWVAVSHAPRELGFRPLTISLVDLAADLQLAVRQCVLSADEAAVILRSGAALFYQDRTWPSIAGQRPLSRARWTHFDRWRTALPDSQKSRDAKACIEAARTPAASFAAGLFAKTVYLEKLEAEIAGRS